MDVVIIVVITFNGHTYNIYYKKHYIFLNKNLKRLLYRWKSNLMVLYVDEINNKLKDFCYLMYFY